ncbi:LmbU family transcriptional regulator [Kitasatospora sp. NPDC088346]|uniref:LmbU family transcriptional regulator n=1 Tax=Kitasatospora sp. NPDC088346 TaxID=3364073 RepID=UPI0037FEA44B
MPETVGSIRRDHPTHPGRPRRAAVDGGGAAQPHAQHQRRLGLDADTQARKTSLHLPPSLPLAAWMRVGSQLHTIASSSAWWAGDWLIYGARSYPDRYRQAVERTSLDYQTLRNYAWVARKFEVSRRRDELSFQHHQEVAALPVDEQDQWLDRAAESGWSKTELRRRVRGAAAAPEPTSVVRTRLQFELVEDQWSSWREAADRDGEDVVAWLVKLADRACAAPDPGAPE